MESGNNRRKTLNILPFTYRELKFVGEFGESADELIHRLVEHYVKTASKTDNKFDGKGVEKWENLQKERP